MDIKLIFGLNLKNLRLKKGWSQEKLALNSNIDRTYIPSIEAGKRNVSILIIQKLAISLEVEISEFFKNIDNEQNS
jgi:transcriptional regulator with XRE-family HTH domain